MTEQPPEYEKPKRPVQQVAIALELQCEAPGLVYRVRLLVAQGPGPGTVCPLCRKTVPGLIEVLCRKRLGVIESEHQKTTPLGVRRLCNVCAVPWGIAIQAAMQSAHQARQRAEKPSAGEGT